MNASDARLRAIRSQLDAAMDEGLNGHDWEWYDQLIVAVLRLGQKDQDRLTLMAMGGEEI